VVRTGPLQPLGPRRGRQGLSIGSWETFEHEADVGLLLEGTDGPDLFATAGLALFDLVCDVPAVEEREEYELTGEADGIEPLLVDWLNDLVYLFEGGGAVCRRFEFSSWSDTAYRATAHGEPVDEARHDPRDLVKAATYHGLAVRRRENRLEARVILDV
jgi:SHS2 domain-containing protein